MKTIPRAVMAGLLVFVLGLIALRLINQTTRPAAASQTIDDLQASSPLVISRPAQAPASISLVYAETRPESNESTLFAAPADNPSQKTALATISHKTGYPPVGAVSPDGSKIAFMVIPPQVDERAARTGSGEIWTVNSDGSGLTRAAFRAGWLEQWSPDSRWIVFSRLTPLTVPNDPQVPFRTEFYRASADGSTGNLLLSDDISYAVVGLGWSAEGAYLAAREDLSGVWRITAQDAASGQTVQTWTLPETNLLRSISLSPDGRRVMFEDLADEQSSVNVFELDAQTVQAQASLAAAPFPDELPVGPLQPLWRGSQDVWIYHQPREGEGAQAGLAGNESSAALPQLATAAGEFLLPRSWSPDAGWLLWQLYPRNDKELYLQKDGASGLARIAPDQAGNWLTPFGWIIPAGGGQ